MTVLPVRALRAAQGTRRSRKGAQVMYRCVGKRGAPTLPRAETKAATGSACWLHPPSACANAVGAAMPSPARTPTHLRPISSSPRGPMGLFSMPVAPHQPKSSAESARSGARMVSQRRAPSALAGFDDDCRYRWKTGARPASEWSHQHSTGVKARRFDATVPHVNRSPQCGIPRR